MEEEGFERRMSEKKKGVIAFSLLTLVFFVFSLLPGLGYNSIIEANVVQGFWVKTGEGPAGVQFLTVINGSIRIYYNPFFYPITCLSIKNFQQIKFVRISQISWDIQGYETARMVLVGVLFWEFLKNIPYFLIASCVIVLCILRIMRVHKVKELIYRMTSLKPKEGVEKGISCL